MPEADPEADPDADPEADPEPGPEPGPEDGPEADGSQPGSRRVAGPLAFAARRPTARRFPAMPKTAVNSTSVKAPVGQIVAAGAIRKCPRGKEWAQWINFATRAQLAVCAQLLDIIVTGMDEQQVLGLVLKAKAAKKLDKKTVFHLAEIAEERSKKDWSDSAYMGKFDPRVVKVSIKELERNAGA